MPIAVYHRFFFCFCFSFATEEDSVSVDPSPPDNALPLKPGAPPSAITDTSRLDTLFRIEVMMLELMGEHTHRHRTHCLQALGYCQLLWRASNSMFDVNGGNS